MKASETRLVFNLNRAATENLNVNVARSTKTASFYAEMGEEIIYIRAPDCWPEEIIRVGFLMDMCH